MRSPIANNRKYMYVINMHLLAPVAMVPPCTS